MDLGAQHLAKHLRDWWPWVAWKLPFFVLLYKRTCVLRRYPEILNDEPLHATGCSVKFKAPRRCALPPLAAMRVREQLCDVMLRVLLLDLLPSKHALTISVISLKEPG